MNTWGRKKKKILKWININPESEKIKNENNENKIEK